MWKWKSRLQLFVSIVCMVLFVYGIISKESAWSITIMGLLSIVWFIAWVKEG